MQSRTTQTEGDWASRDPMYHHPAFRRIKHESSSSHQTYTRPRSGNLSPPPRAPLGVIGVCALDAKARSKPSRNILNRLVADKEFDVVIFGDKVILDEDVKNWPACDYLICFYTDGFPLDKAIAYVKARNPFCVNDLLMQKILWDRRLVLELLDKIGVPTPRRVEVSRDGGPNLVTPEIAKHVQDLSGVVLNITPRVKQKAPLVELLEDGNTLSVDGHLIHKPFVEKPISAGDHDITVYYPQNVGGGARRLFRKIGNKSSEYVEDLVLPRIITEPDSSYIYEELLRQDNAEDVKVYTIGSDYFHAETRKSPMVDGIVRRNTHGKEVRYITNLNAEEKDIAAKISAKFGQRVCNFDFLRTNGESFVNDVNGWGFAKDNTEYYDLCAASLRRMFKEFAIPRLPSRDHNPGEISSLHETETDDEKRGVARKARQNISLSGDTGVDYVGRNMQLKGVASVFRHADTTPLETYKFTFVDESLLDLLKNDREETILSGSEGGSRVLRAVNTALQKNVDEPSSLKTLLKNLRDLLVKACDSPGLTVHVKPVLLDAEDKVGAIRQIQLIVKCGGEPTHSALHQLRELGDNLKNEFVLLNRDILDDVSVNSSGESRTVTSAQIWSASFLGQDHTPENIIIRQDLLDESRLGLSEMENTRARLKVLTREGNEVPPQFAWPEDMPGPAEVQRRTVQLMKLNRTAFEQKRELILNHGIRNTANASIPEASHFLALDAIQGRWCSGGDIWDLCQRWEKLFIEFCDNPVELYKISELYNVMVFDATHNRAALEWLFSPIEPQSSLARAITSLKELYQSVKILFDLIHPQEYGVSDSEKLDIGLSTSLPLLEEIVHNMEDLQASDTPKAFFYFTQESHLYTLLNCIFESGIETKLMRRSIPELGPLSHIFFELYEATSKYDDTIDLPTFQYSIRISISPGCIVHDPLDYQLDSKHRIDCINRRSLTWHVDWRTLIETIKKPILQHRAKRAVESRMNDTIHAEATVSLESKAALAGKHGTDVFSETASTSAADQTLSQEVIDAESDIASSGPSYGFWSENTKETGLSSAVTQSGVEQGNSARGHSLMTFYNFAVTRKSLTEDDFDIQSVSSVTDDIASLADSSLEEHEFRRAAADYLVRRFTDDTELLPLYQSATNRMTEAKFVRNNRRLLKRYFLNLQAEGQTASQKLAIRFLRSRSDRTRISAQIFQLIKPSDGLVREKINILLEQNKDKLLLLNRLLDQRDSITQSAIGDITDASRQMEDSIDDRASDDTDSMGDENSGDDASEDKRRAGNWNLEDELLTLKSAAEFLTAGNAFSLYKDHLHQFLRPGGDSRPHLEPIVSLNIDPVASESTTQLSGLNMSRGSKQPADDPLPTCMESREHSADTIADNSVTRMGHTYGPGMKGKAPSKTHEMPMRSDPTQDGSIPVHYGQWLRKGVIGIAAFAAKISEPRLDPSHERLRWRCYYLTKMLMNQSCGTMLYGDFQNGNREAHDELANRIQVIRSQIGDTPTETSSVDSRHVQTYTHPRQQDVHGTASSQPSTEQSCTSSTQLPQQPYATGSHTSSASNTVTTDRHNLTQQEEELYQLHSPGSRKTYFEVCVNTGSHAVRLGEIDISSVDSDAELFNRIWTQYDAIRGNRLRKFFIKPTNIHFVYFGVRHRFQAGIYKKPLEIPPEVEVAAQRYHYYECPIEVLPPMPANVFLHYLFCAGKKRWLAEVPGAHKEGFFLQRLPKKVNSSIFDELRKQGRPGVYSGIAYGWGVHIIEGPDHAMLSFALGMGVFASFLVSIIVIVAAQTQEQGFGVGQWMVAVVACLMAGMYFKLTEA